MRVLIGFMIGFLFIFSTSGLYAGELKVAVFDIQKIMKNSKVIEGYRQKIATEIEPERKSFIDKQKAAQEIEERLKKEGQNISLNERKELEDRLANEIKELRRMKEDIDIELQRRDRELTQRVFKEIAEIVKKIADKDGYTIVFEKNAAGIVHMQGSVDISQKIINLYDKR